MGWDAADWKIIQPLLDRGEMPVLARVIEGGVMGNLASIRPMLSPMLWNSIATGKRPYQHGVHGFTEVDPELRQPVLVSSASRRCRAVWDILDAHGLKTHVVGWFATHPAAGVEGSVCVSDRFASPAPEIPGAPWPLPRGAVSPAALSDLLADLRVRPEEITGDVLRLLVPRLAEVNQERDKRLHGLAIHLAECFSIHAAATHLLEHEPWDFAAVYYRTIDWVCHDFMSFHPPRMAEVWESEFEIYRDVVANTYRLHDALLGRLLGLAGEDVTVLVVSDHGFQSDHLRPAFTPDVPAGIAAWHRPTGVLAMRGPGLRQDELIHGASLLDVTPTVLALYGLPTGQDMDGRVLAEAFTKSPALDSVPTWETSRPANPADAADGTGGRSADEEWSLVRQFVALGYLDDPGDNPEEAVRSTERENRWNLARAYLDARRYEDALPLLEDVYAQWPERRDYAHELAVCQTNLGLEDEALETAGTLDADPSHPGTRLLLSDIEFRRANYAASLAHLRAIDPANTGNAGWLNRLGLNYLRLHQWAPAEDAFGRTLALDPDDAYAHLGLAHCQVQTRRYKEGAHSALRAVGLRFELPMGHYHLGLALARLGDDARAIQALETCLRYQPTWAPAHRYLVKLYARQPDDGAASKAHEHRRLLAERPQWQEACHERLTLLRQGIAERARVRDEERARRRALHTREASSASTVATAALDFLIVSGLPRSGTSLMMQMLAAAGLETMTDDRRPADASNPRGYYEWQGIKMLPRDPRVIEQAHGKVTKVVSMLLPFLPRAHHFRVIFMTRPTGEVAASQRQMLSGEHEVTGMADSQRLAGELETHRQRMLELLRQSSNVELLEVSYPGLLVDSTAWTPCIARFAGLETECAAAMSAAIVPELCHH